MHALILVKCKCVYIKLLKNSRIAQRMKAISLA